MLLILASCVTLLFLVVKTPWIVFLDRLHSKIMFNNKQALHCWKRNNVCCTNSWLNTSEYEKLCRTTLLGWEDTNFAIRHGKLKFPYHTDKIFTFKLRVSWLVGMHCLLALSVLFLRNAMIILGVCFRVKISVWSVVSEVIKLGVFVGSVVNCWIFAQICNCLVFYFEIIIPSMRNND